MRTSLAIAALLAVAGVSSGGPPPRQPRTASTEPLRDTPEAVLARAKQDYAHSEYQRVVQAVHPLVYPEVLLAPDDELTARKLLALSYFYRREVQLAADEFRMVLQIKEDFALDALYEPATVIKFLEDIRAANKAKLDELAAQKRKLEEIKKREDEIKKREEEEARRRAALPVLTERIIRKNHLVINFIPFGAGQFQNGEWRLGVSLLVTEVALGAGSLALWTSLQAKYFWPQIKVPNNERGLANGLNIAAVVTGALFWAEVATGIIEALVRYKPQVITERKITGKPVAVRPYVAPEGGGGMLLLGAF